MMEEVESMAGVPEWHPTSGSMPGKWLTAWPADLQGHRVLAGRGAIGLTIQVRRAALSIPTNIAEGVAKRGKREFGRYLDIAPGSLSELTYLLRSSRDLGLLTAESWLELEDLRDQAGKLTWRLYRTLSK